ncbi:hypothetical protein LOK49_LG06G03114 [Camellia lanceoleosa]|uniref:Uncharacterized protein n=1 Tax=Camellia lanceoleosa TaxID=1840588 RepID=A0ACC0HBY6_9ERIC|nr:hypothetical protein LOK49_LG06G03114 [Camellia lanceoleosa]
MVAAIDSSAAATLDGSRLVRRLNGLAARLVLLFSSIWKKSQEPSKGARGKKHSHGETQFGWSKKGSF